MRKKQYTKMCIRDRITQGPELQHSAKGEPYVRFSAAEYVGCGSQRHAQFILSLIHI